jgi:hypothetical protein
MSEVVVVEVVEGYEQHGLVPLVNGQKEEKFKKHKDKRDKKHKDREEKHKKHKREKHHRGSRDGAKNDRDAVVDLKEVNGGPAGNGSHAADRAGRGSDSEPESGEIPVAADVSKDRVDAEGEAVSRSTGQGRPDADPNTGQPPATRSPVKDVSKRWAPLPLICLSIYFFSCYP